AGSDGRAGMAALVLGNGSAFDAPALYRHVAGALPAYARPLFLRISKSLDVTGTLKQQKQRYRDEGFDPAKIPDPLYFRDDEAKSYVSLSAPLFADIQAGRCRV